MPLTTKHLTAAKVEAEIKKVNEEYRKRLRHLRALRRCLADEADGQVTLLPDEPETEDSEPE